MPSPGPLTGAKADPGRVLDWDGGGRCGFENEPSSESILR